MRRSPVRQSLLFAAVAVVVVGAFVVIAKGYQSYDVWHAESFGDRRLATPVVDECGIARAVVDYAHTQDQAAWLRTVQAGESRLGLRAFAWRTNGPRGGRGADWRACPGLGAYTRKLGMEPMGGRYEGPTLFISRPDFRSGRGAEVFETLYAPVGEAMRPLTWRVSLSKVSGQWRITGRLAADPPTL